MFGVETIDKSFDRKTPMEIAYKRADALFKMQKKLSIDYFCFHDRDIAPEGSTLEEINQNLETIAISVIEKQKKTGKKCLWGTAIKKACRKIIKKNQDIVPNVENHKKYMGFYSLFCDLYPDLLDDYKTLSDIKKNNKSRENKEKLST